jgi:hypothetical protein
MKKFIITEQERSRILGMHKKSTSRHYLMEQPTDNETQDDMMVNKPGSGKNISSSVEVTLKNNTKTTTEMINAPLEEIRDADYFSFDSPDGGYTFVGNFDETKYSIGDQVLVTAKIPLELLKVGGFLHDNIIKNSITKSGKESFITITFNYTDDDYGLGTGLYYDVNEKGPNGGNKKFAFVLEPKN